MSSLQTLQHRVSDLPPPVLWLPYGRSLSLDKLLQVFTKITWFGAIASISRHFYWEGLVPCQTLKVRRNEVLRDSFVSLYSLTIRIMIWQAKGMGHEAALELCPKIPCLIVMRHPSYFTEADDVCICMCYIPHFKSQRERKKPGTNYHFSLVSSLVYSHWTGTTRSQQLLLQISIFWHINDSIFLHG